MDVPLYAIAMVLFAVLYLAIGVFLVYTLLISLIIILLYTILRYQKLPEDYPYGVGDVTITMIFIGVTWTIFTFLAQKSPLPFIGNGFTYTNPNSIATSTIIAIAVVALIIFLVIFSLFPREGGAQPALGSGEKPKQGVGAG